MEMQDKEFDDLFRSKMDGFGIEPSPDVWTGIAGELNAGVRKKALFSWLSIVASIIVLITAGVLFIPQKGNVKHPVKNPVKNQPGLTNQTVIKNNTKPGPSDIKDVSKQNETAIAAGINKQPHHSKTINNTSGNQSAEPSSPVKIDDKTELAAIHQNKQEVINAVVPDEATPLTVKQLAHDSTPFITKPAITPPQLSIAGNQNPAPVKVSHKIRNFGDLVNAVVAKVDKRKNKIIEFTHTDDSETTIAEVNLGIIQIRKEK